MSPAIIASQLMSASLEKNSPTESRKLLSEATTVVTPGTVRRRNPGGRSCVVPRLPPDAPPLDAHLPGPARLCARRRAGGRGQARPEPTARDRPAGRPGLRGPEPAHAAEGLRPGQAARRLAPAHQPR